MRALVGRHLPEEFVREHLATLEREADERLAALTRHRRRQGREARGTARDGRHGPPAGDPGPAGPARGPHRRRPRHRHRRLGADRGGVHGHRAARPWWCPPHGRARLPPKRALVAWDGSREAARAAGDAVPLLQAAEDVVVLTVDAHRGGARFSDRPGFGLTTYLTRHGAKARVKQVAASGGIADTILDQVGRGAGRSPGDGRLRPFAGARDDVRRRHPLDPGKHGLPDPGLALTPTCARSCASSPGTLRLIERPRPEPRPARSWSASAAWASAAPTCTSSRASTLSRISARHGARAGRRGRRRRRGRAWSRARRST